MGRRFTEDEVRELIAETVAPLLGRIAELEAEVARLKKNSGNSSKPPSSDIVKPPRAKPSKKRRGKRRPGGQPGHAKHERKPFGSDEIDQVVEYELTDEDACGLQPLDEWRVLQQVELVERPLIVTEHRARRYLDPRTGRIHTAPLPREIVNAGLIGPRLSAAAAFQKAACHMSYTTIQNFWRQLAELDVSRGQWRRVVGRVSAALQRPYQQLCDALPDQRVLGIDESGHKDSGKRHWTWCFRAERFTVFRIDPSRGSDVLRRMLGETFGGVIGCDYFSAYRKYMADAGATVQFCMAHLIREVRFLAEHSSQSLSRWGGKLLNWLKQLFQTLHRAGELSRRTFARRIDAARQGFLRQVRHPPSHTEAQALARRFRGRKADHYFTFLTRPGVEPTNNLTEQAIRHVVIDRRITQGTRGDSGMRWCERAWTVVATCAQQGRRVFEFFLEAVQTHLTNRPTPSLLAEG